MLIVLFAIFLLMIIMGIVVIKVGVGKNYGDERDIIIESGLLIILIGGIIESIIAVSIIVNATKVSKISIMDSKIAMYEEENNNIQKSVSEIVENYMNYESNTYASSIEKIDLKNLDVIMATQIYPDLKANQLVMQQINVYTENSNKIKQVKEEKFDYQCAKWWLYFGKMEG